MEFGPDPRARAVGQSLNRDRLASRVHELTPKHLFRHKDSEAVMQDGSMAEIGGVSACAIEPFVNGDVIFGTASSGRTAPRGSTDCSSSSPRFQTGCTFPLAGQTYPNRLIPAAESGQEGSRGVATQSVEQLRRGRRFLTRFRPHGWVVFRLKRFPSRP